MDDKMDRKCEVCRGTGKISIYRSDIEDFEELICPECHGRRIKFDKEDDNT